MKSFLVAAVIATGFVVPALAEETTTVQEHHDSPGVSVGVPGVAGVHVGGSGCASKTVHKEDDAGDSKTVHSTNCD